MTTPPLTAAAVTGTGRRRFSSIWRTKVAVVQPCSSA
jgi:hypothetical protein